MTQITAARLSYRKRMAHRAGFRCHYCQQPLTVEPGHPSSVTRDHKIPLCRGGTGDPRNIAIACWRCNNIKADMTEKEFRALYRRPSDIPAGPVPGPSPERFPDPPVVPARPPAFTIGARAQAAARDAIARANERDMLAIIQGADKTAGEAA